jgi:formylglycine-generating enzyme required for sulfatase activity
MTGINWQSFFPTASMGSTNWSDYDLLSKNQTITGTKTFTNGIKTGLIYPSTDSTTAIQFDKANGTTNVLNIDTTNGNVGIGTKSPSSSFGAVGAVIHLQGLQPGIVLQNNISSSGQIIQFNVSWPTDNFQNFNGATNAAWVFFKYKVNSTGVYYTAHLISGGSATPTADGMGAFVQQGNGQTVVWNYVGDGVLPANVTIYAFSLEMVYIPTGSFYVGDGTSTTVTGQFCAAASHTTPFQVTSEAALTLGGGGAGSLGNNNTSGMNTADDFNDTTTQSLPGSFPKGYNAFYMMKYDISQGQYRDFLNTLTRNQQNNRVADSLSGLTSLPTYVYVSSQDASPAYSVSSYRNGLVVTAISSSSAPMTFSCNLNGTVNGSNDGEWIAMNYLSWMDGAAYAAWAGLRPYTELEFEKAARGPSSVDTGVNGEYAWGTATYTAATGTNGGGTNVETPSNAGANVALGNSGTGGPMRVGSFAASSTTRVQAGASYWGIMDLSGNVWKRPVTVGNTTGRAFTGTNGTGLLASDGNATNSDWPGYSAGEVSGATGCGFRGGTWILGSTYERVSDRFNAALVNTSRGNTYGARFARTSP